jgi:hypothetical protein
MTKACLALWLWSTHYIMLALFHSMCNELSSLNSSSDPLSVCLVIRTAPQCLKLRTGGRNDRATPRIQKEFCRTHSLMHKASWKTFFASQAYSFLNLTRCATNSRRRAHMERTSRTLLDLNGEQLVVRLIKGLDTYASNCMDGLDAIKRSSYQ